MAEEFKPNETSTFDASLPGGAKVRLSTKKMSEWISVLSLVVCSALAPLVWNLIKAIDSLAVTVRSESAQDRVTQTELAAQARLKQDELIAAYRRLACVVTLPEPERKACETLSRLP